MSRDNDRARDRDYGRARYTENYDDRQQSHRGFGRDRDRSREREHKRGRDMSYDREGDRDRSSRRSKRDSPDSPETGNQTRVNADSNARHVADKLAAQCREKNPGVVLARGDEAINQAVKAVAIARQYLEPDTLELSFQPAFRGQDRVTPHVALYLDAQPQSQLATVPEEDGISITIETVGWVAKELAKRVSESTPVFLQAIGPMNVSKAVLAIGSARVELQKDGLDIWAIPEFVKVWRQGRELSAIKFNIDVHKIDLQKTESQ